jgi:hypothetical protein
MEPIARENFQPCSGIRHFFARYPPIMIGITKTAITIANIAKPGMTDVSLAGTAGAPATPVSVLAVSAAVASSTGAAFS